MNKLFLVGWCGFPGIASICSLNILTRLFLQHLHEANFNGFGAKKFPVFDILLKQLEEKPKCGLVILARLSPEMASPIHRTIWNAVACANPKSQAIQYIIPFQHRVMAPTALVTTKEGMKMPNGKSIPWRVADIKSWSLSNGAK